MTQGKVNDLIIKAIKENSQGDELINEFLINLIFEEAEHAGATWHWKQRYRNRISSDADKWRKDEN